MKVINDVTAEGLEHGYHLSRFADKEERDNGPLANGRERCITCAFRMGTYPSGSPTTTMDALKCVMEGVTFNCHEDTRQVCAGYALLRRASPESKTVMPWPFSDEMDED